MIAAEVALGGAIGCYGVASVAYIRGIATPVRRHTGWRFALAGVLLELMSLGVRGLLSGRGLAPTVLDWLMLATAALVLAFLVWARRVEEASGGAFFLPMVFALLLPGMFLPDLARGTHLEVTGAVLWLHIASLALGFAALSVASVAALMRRVAERRLRRGELGGVPPLESLSALAARALAIGLPVFLLGMVLGAVYARRVWGAYWSWNAKETLSFIAFCLYAAAYLCIRRSRRSPLGDWLLALGVIALLVNLWVVDLIPGPHGYGA